MISLKCKYCNRTLIENWCSCEDFLVKEKGLEPLVALRETKGHYENKSRSGMKVASLSNRLQFELASIKPIRKWEKVSGVWIDANYLELK